jgi:hypothetical protein
MKRSFRCLGLVAAVLLWGVAGAAGEAAGQQPERPILQPGGPSAATDLRVEARCSPTQPGTRSATFMWRVAKTRGQGQRVDVTMFRDGFRSEKPRFETVAQVPGTQDSAPWDKGEPGINYYWRVLTLTAKGWVPSQTSRYEAPICPVDSTPEPRKPE